MTFNVTIPVSESLEKQIKRFRDRLPEALERGLRDIMAEQAGKYHDEAAIIEMLTSNPSPEKILAIQPSLELQERASYLLAKNKESTLSSHEEAELEHILTLEHLVRMAKVRAYKQVGE